MSQRFWRIEWWRQRYSVKNHCAPFRSAYRKLSGHPLQRASLFPSAQRKHYIVADLIEFTIL
jgi:hypothetical protein